MSSCDYHYFNADADTGGGVSKADRCGQGGGEEGLKSTIFCGRPLSL